METEGRCFSANSCFCDHNAKIPHHYGFPVMTVAGGHGYYVRRDHLLHNVHASTVLYRMSNNYIQASIPAEINEQIEEPKRSACYHGKVSNTSDTRHQFKSLSHCPLSQLMTFPASSLAEWQRFTSLHQPGTAFQLQQRTEDTTIPHQNTPIQFMH